MRPEEGDLDEEIRGHLALNIKERIERGEDPATARRAALKEFGYIPAVREEMRRVWYSRWYDEAEALAREVRFALRSLIRAKTLTVTVVLTLALGIGANAAVFSVFNAVLLRPFPYPDAERIAMVFENNPKKGVPRYLVCPPDFLEWRDSVSAFETAAAYRGWSPNLTGIDQAERLTGLRVSGTFFEALGMQPVLGRTLRSSDEAQRTRVVVIAHDLWQHLFGGDLHVIGRTLRLDGESHELVGVMPAEFRFPTAEIQIWSPLNLDRERDQRSEHSLAVVARLRGGSSVNQARDEVGALMARRERENDGCSASAAPLRDWYVTSGNRQMLQVLLGAVGLLLLVACANVANLLLARGGGRARELMVRSALGASRGRLILQLLVESFVLALLGGSCALVLAVWSRGALVALLPVGSVYRLAPLDIDWRVLAYTFGISLAAALVVGLMPAVRCSKTDFNQARAAARATSFRLRSSLLVVQTALAVTLLAGAGLLVRTFVHLWRTDPGFSARHVVAARVTLPGSRTPEQRTAFFNQVLGRLAVEPQVAFAGAVTNVPLGGAGNSNYITFEGRESLTANHGDRPGAERLIVTPGYFQALGIALADGRVFTDQDVHGTLPVVIVNETMARRYWPNESPVGYRIKRGTPQATFPWMTVVGVVRDVRQNSLAAQANPMVYLPFAQTPEPGMTLLVKARPDADASGLSGTIRAAVRGADPDQPIAWLRPLDDVVFGSLSGRWLPMMWMTVFAILALGVAAAGVYGVVSYAVELRRREFGIRMALGADRAALVRLAIRHGLLPALAGAIVGAAAALALARMNERLLFGVSPTDVPTLAAAAAAIAVIALVASYAPARRISSEDASLALRCE
jgi:putative ABC transport system permease protein